MMTPMRLGICVVGLMAALSQGCANDPAPMLENRLGSAVRSSEAQQTIDLDASKNRDPVAGIDGVAAKITIEQYHRSFEAPPPTFTILNGSGLPTR